MKALSSLRSIRTAVLALALGAVGVAAALAARPAAAQSPPDDLDDPGSYAISVGVDPSALRIWTDAPAYRVGDAIRFCYTVPFASQIAIYDEQPGGRVTTLLAGRDDGRGDCLVGTVTPPTGRECLRLRFFYRGGSVSRAACFDVLGGGTVTPPTGGAPRAGGAPGGRAIDWGYTPGEHREKVGQRFAYTCPANNTLAAVWGTDVYTDDSSVCTAAVHAGLITTASGGAVTIEMLGRQESFRGSTRNGVATRDWGGYPGAFRFVR